MDGERNLATEVRPGARKRDLRTIIGEHTGPRHREVQVDEATWDYLMELKKLFGLDNLRQAMTLVRHLAHHGVERRREAVLEDDVE